MLSMRETEAEGSSNRCEVAVQLWTSIMGSPQSDPVARILALLLLSSLLEFQLGRSIPLRTMNWSTAGPVELAMVPPGVEVQIEAIGGHR